jgi:hypothetical protein
MIIYLHNVALGKPLKLIEEYISDLEDVLVDLEVNRSREDAAASCTVFESENNEHRMVMSFDEWESSRKAHEVRDGYEINCKRFYLPIVLTSVCPKCGRKAERNLEEHYLAYPETGEGEILFCCLNDETDCEHEWQEKVKFRIIIEHGGTSIPE